MQKSTQQVVTRHWCLHNLSRALAGAVLAHAVLSLHCSSAGDPFSPQMASTAAQRPKPGDAAIAVRFGRVGCLGDRVAAPQIELTQVRLRLTAPGETPVVRTFPASGNEAMTVAQTVKGLAAKTWTLAVRSRDMADSTIHEGATSFTVMPKQTVMVTLHPGARYSMLRASVFPVQDSVTRCELLIDGAVSDDSSFAKQTHLGDTIPLWHNYVRTGPGRAIGICAWGVMWGFEALLYKADTAITVVPGLDAPCALTLAWVGPSSPPPGAAAMTVNLGDAGTVAVNGVLEDISD